MAECITNEHYDGQVIDENSSHKKSKKKITKKRKKELIFVAILLAYPVIQFLLTWIFVNSYSIIMAFQSISMEGETSFNGFNNFITVIKDLFSLANAVTVSDKLRIPYALMILINSLGYAIITIFISLPLALISSYFLSKKMILGNVFRVIFFLPNIISTVALVYAFRMQVIDSSAGLFFSLFKSMGITFDRWPNTSSIVYIYCIWAGLGYNVLLLSGAIGRIPKELFESAQMDGASSFKEFTHIMIPMIWPTIVTLIVLGLTNILTLYLQPVLFNLNNNETIAGSIFEAVQSGHRTKFPYYAAFGLFFSVIIAPIILLSRKKLSSIFSDTDF